LKIGDAVLLIRTTGGEGDIPVLCIVEAYWQERLLELSNALWTAKISLLFSFSKQYLSI
jgi:5-methylcytosine-specific restriction protein A